MKPKKPRKDPISLPRVDIKVDDDRFEMPEPAPLESSTSDEPEDWERAFADHSSPVSFDHSLMPQLVPSPEPSLDRSKPRKKKSILSGKDSETARQHAAFMIYYSLGPERSPEALSHRLHELVREGSVSQSLKISPEKGLCWERAFAWKERAAKLDTQVISRLDAKIVDAAAENIALTRSIISESLRRTKKLMDEDESYNFVRTPGDLKKLMELDHWCAQIAKQIGDGEDGSADTIIAKTKAAGVSNAVAQQILGEIQARMAREEK